jgi:hypothetical protein
MTSIVLELQREAYEHNTSISILLRKAYTLAKKLQVTEFEKWCDLELNGYDNHELPDYRFVHGEVKARNPYVGYIPAIFTPELHEIISKRNIPQPITEIEEYVRTGETNGNGTLMYTFTSDQQLMLMKLTGHDFQISLHIPTSQFKKIIDRVRNIILEWTLKLEEQNVRGEGMTFSDNEKQRASKTEGTIINYIGNMSNSQLQQNTTNSTQTLQISESIKDELTSLIHDIKKLKEEVADPELQAELTSELEVLEAQVKSPKPKHTIIGETLKSIRNITEGIAGSLIASGIAAKIPIILTTLGVS